MVFVKGISFPSLVVPPLITSLFLFSEAWAQTRFTPQESAILLKLEASSAENARLRDALARWRKDPQNIGTATESARTAILAAIRQGDLRWLGNAKAMLEPWWDSQGVPSETLFIRALVRQGTHDFERALVDLNAAITKDPQQPEFWAWRFAIYMVRAEIPKARSECAAIGSRFGTIEQESCNAVLLYRTGYPQQAIPVLDRLARHPDYQGQNAQEWLAFHRGEARRVAGDRAGAKKVWESHLKGTSGGHGVRVALIDLLNRDGQYTDAWKLNDKPPRSDALLVAAIQTAQALKNDQSAALLAELSQRLTQQAARGDSIIERPIVKYYLMIRQDAKQALTMAQTSWKTEREPADALLYAQAAIDSGQPEQAMPVLQWQQDTGYREPELDRLLATIRQAISGKEKR